MSEGYLWVNMGMKYDTVYIGKVIYLCDYLEGGLTKAGRKLRLQCPLGGMANCNAFLSVRGERKLNLKTTLKEIWLYVCYGKFAGLSYREMLKACKRPLLFAFNYPFGVLLYWIWRKQYA